MAKIFVRGTAPGKWKRRLSKVGATVYCPNCGVEISSRAVFCRNCRTNLRKAAKAWDRDAKKQRE